MVGLKPGNNPGDLGMMEVEMESLNPTNGHANGHAANNGGANGKASADDKTKDINPFSDVSYQKLVKEMDVNELKRVDFGKLKNIDWKKVQQDAQKIKVDDVKRYLQNKLKQCMAYLVWFSRAYPRGSKVVFAVVGLLFFKILFLRHRGEYKYIPPHLREHFGDIDGYYNLKTAHISHWCLFGDDTSCQCSDTTEPTEGDSETWRKMHQTNNDKVKSKNNDLDVIFLGDEMTNAFNGAKYFEADPTVVSSDFEKRFTDPGGWGLNAIAQGISDDTTSNLLWRIENGEIPKDWSPKIFWVHIGMNDLANNLCSEEAVTLGILKIADRIFEMNPGVTIVLQGLMPRSTLDSGIVNEYRGTKNETHVSAKVKKRKSNNDRQLKRNEFFAKEDYPLWPAIRAINKELKHFASKQDHLVYFDVDNLFLGSMGNEHYRETNKQIVKDLMPDFAHLSSKGFEIMLAAIEKEVQNILDNSDEGNVVVQKQDVKLRPDDGRRD